VVFTSVTSCELLLRTVDQSLEIFVGVLHKESDLPKSEGSEKSVEIVEALEGRPIIDALLIVSIALLALIKTSLALPKPNQGKNDI
jgi:hypothetical protein